VPNRLTFPAVWDTIDPVVGTRCEPNADRHSHTWLMRSVAKISVLVALIPSACVLASAAPAAAKGIMR
jgi:hypothetical protein